MYKFPPMLKPAENYPAGSFDWAQSWAARLQGASQNVDDHTSVALRRLMIAIKDGEVWRYFPDPPAGTPEDFCQIICDRSWESLIKDVVYHTKDKKIARQLEYQLRVTNAQAQVENRSQGTRTDLLVYDVHKLERGGNRTSYLLRRLLRERPDLVSRIERGELSPNAAAIEAGFRKKRRCPHCGHEL